MGGALHRATPRPPASCSHARRLAFAHPATGEHVHFEAPLPEDFQHTEARLGGMGTLTAYP